MRLARCQLRYRSAFGIRIEKFEFSIEKDQFLRNIISSRVDQTLIYFSFPACQIRLLARISGY